MHLGLLVSKSSHVLLAPFTDRSHQVVVSGCQLPLLDRLLRVLQGAFGQSSPLAGTARCFQMLCLLQAEVASWACRREGCKML